MKYTAPLRYLWDGTAFAVVARHERLADEQFTVGELYTLEVVEERSKKAHDHQFAHIEEVWRNLPDHLAMRFPTAVHLRKFALIQTGWADTHTLVCSSKAEALRVAAFCRPIDEFSVVVAKEATVTRYVAKSQSRKAMGAEDFKRSKQDVLDYISALIGSSPQEVTREAGRAA